MTDTQPLYVVRCTYGPGAHALRDAAMPAHLEYLHTYRHRLRFAGPLLADDGQTVTGSNAIVEVADRAAAEGFIADEAFNRAGMFDDIEILRFASAVGDRQVRITPDPRRELYLCRWIATADAHLPNDRVLETSKPAGPARVLEGGWLLSDEAARLIGAVLILEVPDRPAAEQMTDELQRRSGMGGQVHVSRWRFGQALAPAVVPPCVSRGAHRNRDAVDPVRCD